MQQSFGLLGSNSCGLNSFLSFLDISGGCLLLLLNFFFLLNFAISTRFGYFCEVVGALTANDY